MIVTSSCALPRLGSCSPSKFSFASHFLHCISLFGLEYSVLHMYADVSTHPPSLDVVYVCLMNSNRNIVIVSWNVRGLGHEDKCAAVRDVFATCHPSIACVQETKLSDIPPKNSNPSFPPLFLLILSSPPMAPAAALRLPGTPPISPLSLSPMQPILSLPSFLTTFLISPLPLQTYTLLLTTSTLLPSWTSFALSPTQFLVPG